MDPRTKVYPPLPPRSGPGARKITVALPMKGDLSRRPMLPNLFLQQFAIHCNAEHRQVYAKFLIERRFIVMSNEGDLFTQTIRVTLRLTDLPNASLLPLPPPLSTWDIVKVLDLVQCYTFSGVQGASLVPNVRWELVRVRWRNSRETWIPIELMASQSPALLQEFYVNSLNSWGFHDRVFAQSLTTYRTEIELWLHQPEFQRFYEQLRRRRGLAASRPTPQTNGATRNPAPASSSATIQDSVDVKDRRLTAEAARANHQTPVPQPRPPVAQPPRASVPPPQPLPASAPSQRPTSHPAPPAGAIRPRIPPPPVIPPQPQPPARTQHPAVMNVARQQPLPPTPPRPSSEQRPDPRHSQPPPRLSLNGSAPRQLATPPPQEQQPPQRAPTYQEIERAEDSSSSKTSKEKKKKKKKKKKKGSDRESEDEILLPSKKSRSKRERRRDEEPSESPASRKRQRKRLKWSQAAAEDSDDDVDEILQLTQKSDQEKAEKKERKRLRRLRKEGEKKKKEASIIVIDDTDEEEEDEAEAAKRRKKKRKEEKKARKRQQKEAADNEDEVEEGEIVEVPMEIDAEAYAQAEEESEDDDAGESGDGPPLMLLGEIRCECGVTTVGKYTGQWLQCWYESCGVWQHAECVGLLVRRSDDEDGETNTRLPEEYRCSKCDVLAFQERYARAKANHLRSWLSLCCESKNEKHLLKLLEDEEKRDASAAAELASSVSKRKGAPSLLVEVARQGLTRALRRLVRRYKVDVFATDTKSQNVLHHVAITGECVPAARFLLTTAPALVRHQDLSGQMPLHHLLRSSKLNALCPPLLRQDPALCVTSDFAGCMPIHFACQAVNKHTVAIVEEILRAQPLAGLERSPEGLTPLLLLCRAASGADNVMQAACVQAIIKMLLDIDVLGGFLRARDIRGWAPIHFATASGNHVLLQWLCTLDGVEVDAATFESGETALHIAARHNHAECIRVLLENRQCPLDPTQVDGGSKWIALVHATEASSLQQLLCHDLEGQLQKISVLAANFCHHEALRRWLLRIVSDPTCYSIVNDWLQFHLHILDDLDAIFALHRSILRVDNKLDYQYQVVFHTIKNQSRRIVSKKAGSSETTAPSEDAAALEISLSPTTGECYWKQFVAQTRDLDALAFRQKLHIVIPRGSSLVLDNLTLVLVRLLSGLLQPSTGLLVRDPLDATLMPSPLRAADDPETLREFYVLGELVAYLVLSDVSLGEVFEFSTPFLQRVLGLRGTDGSPRAATAAIAFHAMADSFGAGFQAVLPATLALLQVEELRLVLNARTHSLIVSSVNWSSAVNWIGFDTPTVQDTTATSGDEPAASTVAWWTRLTTELLEEEHVALVLWLCGSFRFAQRLLFVSADADADTERPRVNIQRYNSAPTTTSGSEGVALEPSADASFSLDEDDDDVLPKLVVTTDQRTLALPQYSSYERFRVALLRVFRRADSVPTLR